MTSWVSTEAGRHLRGRRRVHTQPEIDLRRALHALGARFRLQRTISRGCTPDLVLPRRRIAVFVDGDYWHSCPVHGRKEPFSGPNAHLWERKMQRNRQRDAQSTALAVAAGWVVVRVWECSIRADPMSVANAVLRGISPPPAV
jgi:DNA mismatch endonuclease (patch repair protein)